MKSIILYFFLLFSLSYLSHAQYKPNLLVLDNTTLIDASRSTPAVHQTVIVKDGRIADIYPSATKSLPDSAVVVNLKGKYMLPGLIDSHVHMATDPSGIDNRVHTLQVLQQMLYSGVTTVRDMAGDARTLASLARDADANELQSPDIYYSALMAGPQFFSDQRTQTSTIGGVSGNMPYMKAVADTTDIMLAVARAKGSGAAGIKLYANLSAALAGKIIKEAEKQNIPVWAHAWLQGARPSDLVEAGVISISHAPLLIYEEMDKVPDVWKKQRHSAEWWDNSVPALDGLFNEMKQHHTVFDATLLTYKKWAASDTAMQWDYEVAKRITRHAYKAGVTICAGTDDDQEQFVQDEIRLMVTDAGFSPFDAIVAATQNSAAAINIDKRKGCLKPGMDADFVILNSNPLDNIDNIKSVYMVIKNGSIIQKSPRDMTSH